MKRRSFLQLAAITPLLGSLSLLSIPKLNSHPILHGDGIHDDSEALTAVFSNKPYIHNSVLNENSRNVIELPPGKYLVRKQIPIDTKSHVIIKYSDFVADREYRGAVFKVVAYDTMNISYCRFVTNPILNFSNSERVVL